MKNPKVFISYSWDSEEHKEWVIALANELRKSGIDAIVDEFISQKGTVNLNRMMIENIKDRDYTVVVLTDKYSEKSNSFKGGVGYETSLLINDIADNIEKIIPIIRFKGDHKKVIPFYLKGVSYIDFSNDYNFDEKFEELKYKIMKVDRIEMEPLGEILTLEPKKVTMGTLQRKSRLNDDLIPDFREVTDRDKNIFMKNSFNEIINNLVGLAERTNQKNHNFDYEKDIVTNKKIIIRLYIAGMEKHAVKIWLGNNFSREESIYLSYGIHMFDNDNSCNEMIICEVNKNKELKLKMTMSMLGDREEKDAYDISTEIWKHILQCIK